MGELRARLRRMQSQEGQPPAPPMPLLPAPAFSSSFEQPLAAGAELQWQAVVGAASYRLEIFSEGGLQFEQAVVDTQLHLPAELADGNYQAALRAIADTGIEGHNQNVSFALITPPPVPSRLTLNASGNQVAMGWAASPGAATYQVQLAEDPNFEQLVFDSRITDTRASIERAESGRYHLRVKAISAAGIASDFSEPKQIWVDQEESWSWLFGAGAGILLILLL